MYNTKKLKINQNEIKTSKRHTSIFFNEKKQEWRGRTAGAEKVMAKQETWQIDSMNTTT
jgi:hypothetical protein